MWVDNIDERHIQKNIDRDVAQIQSEWSQLKPFAWETFKVGDWINLNTLLSGDNDGTPSKLDRDRIKALGNAIVPQVVFPILKFIELSFR